MPSLVRTIMKYNLSKFYSCQQVSLSHSQSNSWKGYATYSSHPCKQKMHFLRGWKRSNSHWQKPQHQDHWALQGRQGMSQITWAKWPWPWESSGLSKVSSTSRQVLIAQFIFICKRFSGHLVFLRGMIQLNLSHPIAGASSIIKSKVKDVLVACFTDNIERISITVDN